MMQLQYSKCSNANALHLLVPRPAVLGLQFPAPERPGFAVSTWGSRQNGSSTPQLL
jgi:hypothetical protein